MSQQDTPTIIKPDAYGDDVTYEPPLKVGWGIDSKTVNNPMATMGRSVLPPGTGNPNPTHYHTFNDVAWYIISGRVKCTFGSPDLTDLHDEYAEAGDFVYIPRRNIHILENASDIEEAELIFCYIGVPSKEAAVTVFLEDDHEV
jgi:mannose-6-phosphate isomerase-like protein (cupin superfamily)